MIKCWGVKGICLSIKNTSSTLKKQLPYSPIYLQEKFTIRGSKKIHTYYVLKTIFWGPNFITEKEWGNTRNLTNMVVFTGLVIYQGKASARACYLQGEMFIRTFEHTTIPNCAMCYFLSTWTNCCQIKVSSVTRCILVMSCPQASQDTGGYTE